ncbi:hypothetical protein [uncultured Erythrobacter sp.]|uniref:hypothetical protein n=1 Tax=uncultured Erythrobacter sp. TaxID=263913 RepID=UPI0026292B57|nr:hypothetical protein [uncultured Erythrobacter sp.]
MTYKFDRYLLFGVLFGMMVTLPGMSIVELVTTGTIDLEAVGRGRRQIPTWASYLVGWICFLFFLPSLILALKYVAKGEIFSLQDGFLEIDGVSIAPDQIKSWRENWRGFCVKTDDGMLCCHPRLSKNGKKALDEFLSQVDIA